MGTPLLLMEHRGQSSGAHSLAKGLAARAEETERRRTIPAETLQEFVDLGLLRLLVPRRFGGREPSLLGISDAITLLGTGCPSSAWVLSLYTLHSWLVGHFPDQAQDDVFGARGYSLISSPAGVGAAAATSAGYRVSGHFRWASGVNHCEWVILNALNRSIQQQPLLLLVPAAEIRIVDTWNAAGMVATGSHDVLVEDIFVPAHRAIDSAAILRADMVGFAAHDTEPVYKKPYLSLHSLLGICPALGIAASATKYYRDFLANRPHPHPREDPSVATALLSQATMRLDSAWLLHRDAIASLGCTNDRPEEEAFDGARDRAVAAHVAVECRAIVRSIADAAGLDGQLASSPLQRMLRDITVIATHGMFNIDSASTSHGRAVLGQELDVPALPR